jgi:aromatic ring-opening dioxygenase LigB subunit
MPHPPIVIPDVGGGREREAAVTIAGADDLMKKLKKIGKPDVILLLSPHQPYVCGNLALNRASAIRGSFALFGAPRIAFDIRTPGADLDSLYDFLTSGGVRASFSEARDMTRDQGSMVPLYFLDGCYGELPPVILASPIGLDPKEAYELGRLLASFAGDGKWGLLASGDLSHRLKPGAPAGYSPSGEKFDRAVVESLRNADASIIMGLPEITVEEAGECGMRSVLAMLGLVSEMGGKIETLSYEGPFGVGYCNALWTA